MPAPAGGAGWLPQARRGWCRENAHQAVEGGDRRQQGVVGIAASVPPPGPHHHHYLLYMFLPQNPSLVEQYLSAILSLEPNQNYAGMLGLLVQFCTSHKEMDVVNQHKASGLTGREERELDWSCWPQLLALSGARWLSHSGPWPLAVICEL